MVIKKVSLMAIKNGLNSHLRCRGWQKLCVYFGNKIKMIFLLQLDSVKSSKSCGSASFAGGRLSWWAKKISPPLLLSGMLAQLILDRFSYCWNSIWRLITTLADDDVDWQKSFAKLILVGFLCCGEKKWFFHTFFFVVDEMRVVVMRWSGKKSYKLKGNVYFWNEKRDAFKLDLKMSSQAN